MLEGICVLPVIPMRKTQSDCAEMTNQVLFGETFKILKETKNWSYIELKHDNYQGWIDKKQYQTITTNSAFKISSKKYANIKIQKIKQPLILGSLIPNNLKLRNEINLSESLSFSDINNMETWLVKIAKKYLNTPYLWGGRTPLGIDCSGYTQMVFRFFNKQLPRDAFQQAEIGREITTMKDVKLGDLAFFGQKNKITHVGIILKNHQIIHASGKVRIDTINEKGIFHKESNSHTHFLKLIKRII